MTKNILLVVTFLAITFDVYLYLNDKVTISEQFQLWGANLPIEFVYGFLGSHFFFSVKNRYFSMPLGLFIGAFITGILTLLELPPIAEMAIGLISGYIFWPQLRK